MKHDIEDKKNIQFELSSYKSSPIATIFIFTLSLLIIITTFIIYFIWKNNRSMDNQEAMIAFSFMSLVMISICIILRNYNATFYGGFIKYRNIFGKTKIFNIEDIKYVVKMDPEMNSIKVFFYNEKCKLLFQTDSKKDANSYYEYLESLGFRLYSFYEFRNEVIYQQEIEAYIRFIKYKLEYLGSDFEVQCQMIEDFALYNLANDIADEWMLENFENILEALYMENIIDDEFIRDMRVIDEDFSIKNVKGNEYLWELEAVQNDLFWSTQRNRAKSLLDRLNEVLEEK